MGALTTYSKNAWVNHLCGTPHTPAAKMYLALFTQGPGDTGDMTNEVANANGYTRKEITFGAAASRRVTQVGDVTFGPASGSWGTVTHYGIVDSATHGAGNMLAYGSFSALFTPVSGNTPTVSGGSCYVSIVASSGEGYTDYFVHKMLDLMFRNTAYSQPGTYIALLDTAGADTDTTLTTAGKEVSGTNYARVLVNKAGGSSPAWNSVSGGATDNAAQITFPLVGSGGWAGIVGMAIVDGGTLNAGNVLAYDNDQIVDQSAAENDTVFFAAGALDVACG
jgi:hypothetical protein